MSQIGPSLIGAIVAIFGWYVTYFLAKRREDETRRLDIKLKIRAQQIELLYGPLDSLIEQIFNIWDVQKNVLKGVDLSAKDKQRIQDFMWQQYFLPLHEEIGALLRTKLYLLENGMLPKSFSEYLIHATQEACQHRLWSELSIDTSKVPGREWPQQFPTDVKDSLDRITKEYKTGLERLG